MKVSILVFSSVLLVGAWFFFQPNKVSASEDVSRFINSMIADRKDVAKNFVTTEPEHNSEQAYGSKPILDLSGRESSVESYAPSSKPNVGKAEFLDDLFPDLAVSQSSTDFKILNVKEHLNQARVLVGFENDKLVEIHYEYLLIKDSGSWLIFKVLPVTDIYRNRSYDFFASEESGH